MNSKIVAFPVKAQDDQPKKKKKRGERSDGRIQRSWQFERLDNGERDREYFYGKTGAEADRKKEAFKKAYYEEKAALEKKQKELEELGPMAEYLGVTVSVWLEVWKEKYKGEFKSLITAAGYDARIKRINKYIGEMRIEDVRDMHIQPIFRDIEGKSKSLITKTYNTLFNAFSKAFKNKIIKDNPMDDFEVPEGTEGSHRNLEQWECDYIIQHWKDHRAIRWALVMILSGMRTGELAAIDPEDIDLDNRRINIDDSVTFGKNQPIRRGTTKTKAGVRTVPICDLLFSVFEDTITQVDVGPLFRMLNNKPLTKSGIRRSFNTINNLLKKHADSTKNPFIKIRPHDCRHTYATALYDAGVDVKTAQYLLGHSDIHTTLQLYTHLSQQKMNNGVRHILSYLNKWVTEIPQQETE